MKIKDAVSDIKVLMSQKAIVKSLSVLTLYEKLELTPKSPLHSQPIHTKAHPPGSKKWFLSNKTINSEFQLNFQIS